MPVATESEKGRELQRFLDQLALGVKNAIVKPLGQTG
jgi:hypothetical protein